MTDSLDPAELGKSGVQCFLWKLARYYTACYTIFPELIALHRSGNPLNVKIETVPFFNIITTPVAENGYKDLPLTAH
jgi:hypothetical protein